MKRIIASMICLAAILLASCSGNPKCEFDAVSEALKVSDSVRCYVYSDDESYEISGSELSGMIEGTWEASGKPGNFDKILSLTVSTQYEIGFFEGGTAIIYSGYAGVLEKDRQYYTCSLNKSFDEIIGYVKANGFLVVDDEVVGKDSTVLYDAPDGNEVGRLTAEDVALRRGTREDGWCKLTFNGETVYAMESELSAKQSSEE